VVIRLRNERDPDRIVCVTNSTWVSILEIAEQQDWRPLGAVQPEWLWGSESLLYPPEDLLSNNLTYEGGKLVILDDALNLADALERAFLAYEPERIRSYTDLTLFGVFGSAINGRPGIGVILEVAELCQSGAFWIEEF
jgi:hypothetical protein